MPIILVPIDFLEARSAVLSRMVFPGDEEKFMKYNDLLMADAILNAVSQGWDSVSKRITPRMMHTLLHSPSIKQIGEDVVEHEDKKGRVCGIILGLCLRAKIECIPKYSIIKARYHAKMEVQRLFNDYTISVRDIWNKSPFPATAHLWLAFMQSEWLNIDINAPEGFTNFLARAEYYRVAGENTERYKSAKKVLNPEKVWRVEVPFSLPEVSPVPPEPFVSFEEMISRYEAEGGDKLSRY